LRFLYRSNGVGLYARGECFWETSGALPQYFPKRIVHDINTRLRIKFMFGSEHSYFRLVEDILEGRGRDSQFREGILSCFSTRMPQIFWPIAFKMPELS